jgi:hypothetical protein
MRSEKRRRETGDRNRSRGFAGAGDLDVAEWAFQRVFLVDGVGAGRRLNLTARLRAKFAALPESGSGTRPKVSAPQRFCLLSEEASAVDLEAMAVAAGEPVPMESLQRSPHATSATGSPDRPSLHRCEPSSPVKNRMLEIGTSGTVRGEGGNILTYSETTSAGPRRADGRRVP